MNCDFSLVDRLNLVFIADTRLSISSSLYINWLKRGRFEKQYWFLNALVVIASFRSVVLKIFVGHAQVYRSLTTGTIFALLPIDVKLGTMTDYRISQSLAKFKKYYSNT